MTPCDTVDRPCSEGGLLDPDVAELFAEVEAILQAALESLETPTAPSAVDCPAARRRAPSRFRGVPASPRPGPKAPVRAVQRSPPRPRARTGSYEFER
jgi:hypothetical protein